MELSARRDQEKRLVKERISLGELVREVVAEVETRGPDDLWACCPFHREDTPSFHVVPSRGFYKCFGCGEKGDVFTFVQKTRGVDFREALEVLAERAGVELGSLSAEDRRRLDQTRRAREGLERAREAFGRALHTPAGASALGYLRERGFDDATLEAFDVGFVPPGMPLDRLAGAGFTRAFGGRISFGIRDPHGALVGFGARRLGEDDGPKYVNTQQTHAFNKSRLLYALDKAVRTLARTRRLVVMEGYTDVMMAHQRGLTEAVATMGTSLTREHVALLVSRGARNLVLLFDGDEAGQAAAERAVRLLLGEGVEGRVLTLPDGQDPCDWLRAHDVAAFERRLASRAVDSLRFLGERLLGSRDVGQPGVRAEVAREVAELARPVIDDALRRERAIADIARSCGVDRNELARWLGLPTSAPAAVAAPPRSARGVSAEVRCQFVAVAGLAESADRLAELDELVAAGVLQHPQALEILEHARPLLAASTGALDPTEWLAHMREHRPDLEPLLDRVLLPPPELVLPTWNEAISFLRAREKESRRRQDLRDVLSRPDVASNPEMLRSVDESVRGRMAHPPSATSADASSTGTRRPRPEVSRGAF